MTLGKDHEQFQCELYSSKIPLLMSFDLPTKAPLFASLAFCPKLLCLYLWFYPQNSSVCVFGLTYIKVASKLPDIPLAVSSKINRFVQNNSSVRFKLTFEGIEEAVDDRGSALSSFCSWLGVVSRVCCCCCCCCWCCCDVPDTEGAPATVVAAVVDVAAGAPEAGGDGIGAGAYWMQPELVDDDGDAGGEPWLDDGWWWWWFSVCRRNDRASQYDLPHPFALHSNGFLWRCVSMCPFLRTHHNTALVCVLLMLRTVLSRNSVPTTKI